MRVAPAIAMSLLLAAPAHADNATGTHRSPRVALALSLMPTLVGVTLLAFELPQESTQQLTPADQAGLYVGAAAVGWGPSLGHAYAGHVITPGLAVRAGGAAIALFGVFVAVTDCPPIVFGTPSCDPGHDPTGLAFEGIGAAVFVTGVVYDIATAPRAACRYNRAHRVDATISVAPVRTATNAAVPAIALAGRF